MALRSYLTGARQARAPSWWSATQHDPATPYQWAVDLSRDLASGVLLGWNGEGHTSYMQGSRVPPQSEQNPQAGGHLSRRRPRREARRFGGGLPGGRHHRLLIAVNAGSNTVSAFAVFGDRLKLRQVVWSGGTFPVSVTVHGNYMYVLNALNGGSVYGYRVRGGRLFPIFGSLRRLGLNPALMPQFLNTPGQVSFTPSGSKLLVTTKANDNNIDVFFVRRDGRLSFFPVVNHEPGAVPFGIAYDRHGHVVLAEAGPNAVATFALLRNGILVRLHTALTGQPATCWITRAGRAWVLPSKTCRS